MDRAGVVTGDDPRYRPAYEPVDAPEPYTLPEHGGLDPGQKSQFLKPQLITDFCEYNTHPHSVSDVTYLGLHWVGDLAIECELNFLNRPDDGEAVRNDGGYSTVQVWEHTGDPGKPELYHEELDFQVVEPVTRSYK